ncbi:hypothetical protein ACOSP7_025376 [Xanthoceras sorbifolium]
MDYSLPISKRTRSREARMFREYHEQIKKKKVKIGGSESTSQSESTFKVDESVSVGIDCGVDSASRNVCEEESADVVGKEEESTNVWGKEEESANVGEKEEESANVGRKDKGKSVVSEGMDDTVPIMIDDSDDDVVCIGENDDLSAEEHDDGVVCKDDEEDILGETSSFYSDKVDESGGLNCDGEKISGVASHEGSSDDDNEDDFEEYSDDLMVFSSEEDNDDPDDEDYMVVKSQSSVINEDTSSSSEEDARSSSEVEEENYVDECEVIKRGSDGGEKLRRVENFSSICVDEEGEDDDEIEVTARMCDDRGEGRTVEEELDVFVDLDNTKDNEVNRNSSDIVGRKLNCVAKRTRSQSVSECRKKKTELGTASNPFFVDKEDGDLLTGLGDSDNDGGDNDETYHKVCKTRAKKWTIGSGRGNDGKISRTVSKQEKGKFGKRKHNSITKDQDVEGILLNSILDVEEISPEDSLFSRSEVVTEDKSQLDNETFLPLKFNFGNEEPTPPEKSEFEKDLDSLWTEMYFALAATSIGSTASSMDKNGVEPAAEVEHDQAACCTQGKHDLIVDDEIGVICNFCSFVQLEIRYVVPPFAKNPWGRCSRRDSKIEDDSVHDDLDFQDSGFKSQSGVEPCSLEEGTVWDLVPGAKTSMYPHQREGFEFIWSNIAGGINLDELKQPTLADGGNGCIISHAPGTGKTRLAIVFLQAYMKMYPTCRPVIVAPCNMLLTWEEEFQKWKTGITFHNLNNPVLSGKELPELQNPHESLARTLKLFSWKKGGGVLGVSYRRFKILVGGTKNNEVDKQMRKILLELPGLFLFDEGHIPRNDQTGIFKALSEIQTEKRIILSGTPFQNNFEELFNTFYLVRPKFADGMRSRNRRDSVTRRGRKRNEEKGKWASLTSSIGKVADDRLADEKKFDELRTIIAPFVHVHKGTVLQESLPGLRQSVVVLNPFDLQKRVLDGVQGESDMIKQNHFVSLISVHPSLLLELSYEKEESIDNRAELERLRLNPEAGIKTKFVMELLRLSEALNEKVLVFSQFIKPLILIRDQLRESFNWIEGREVLYMDGKQDVRLRQSSINVFNDPLSEVKVLLASTKACSEGINLVGASRVVLLDVAWNPSVDRQAISRAYRLGQKKFVHVYHLVTSGTMEEKKCCRQAKKDWMSNSVFFSSDGDGNDQKISSNTMEDKILEEMVQHDKLKYIEKLIEYDEAMLIDTFGLGDRVGS